MATTLTSLVGNRNGSAFPTLAPASLAVRGLDSEGFNGTFLSE